MDVLDKYKETWKNQTIDDTQKVSKVEIYKMMHKRSSSIAKWIFIIGILEMVILNSLSYAFDLENHEAFNTVLGKFLKNLDYVLYPILFYFLFLFYKNYQRISTTENTKMLMIRIKRTRKTVKYYIVFNIVLGVIGFIIGFTIAVKDKVDFSSTDYMRNIILFIVVPIVIIIVLILLFWLFYQLLYGILLRKLNRNYKELSKLEEE